jgi:GAF domain-containing protein
MIGKAANPNAKTIIPVFWAGLEEGEAHFLLEAAQTAVENGLASGHPVVVRNILADPVHRKDHAAALKHDYGSFVVLPLPRVKEQRGVLLVYATESDAFAEAEIALLNSLSDVTFSSLDGK